jgi:hypothetical protein
MKKKKNLALIIVVAVGIGVAIGLFKANETESLSGEKDIPTFNSEEFMSLYQDHPDSMSALYDGSEVGIVGTILSQQEELVILTAGDNGIIKVTYDILTEEKDIVKGKEVVVIGICTGYLSLSDDLGTEFGDLMEEPDEIGIRKAIVTTGI